MDDLGFPFDSFLMKRKGLYPTTVYRDWSSLQKDVLFLIMDKLTVTDDYVRFGAVCRRWRSIFLEENHYNINKHCSQPFLLIPETSAKVVLYSLSSDSVYGFHFRFPKNNFFQGSSFGWIVTMERKGRSNYHIQLQNPFLSKDRIIDLPPLDNIQRQHVDIHGIGGWDGHYVCKAILSSDPSFNEKDFIVLAIMSRYRGLAFYKSSATSWASIGNWNDEYNQDRCFHDVIFLPVKKEFYALRYNGEVVAINFEVGGGSPTLMQVTPPVPLFDGAVRAYLVEDLGGDLLVVSKFRGREQQHPYKLVVHKLDQGEWVHIHNLGNNILFLGNNTSMARPSSYCPGCQKDCIYFTDDVHSSYPCEQFCGPPSSGIYNLKDGNTRAHYGPKKSTQILSAPIWLEPTLFPSIYDD